MIISDVWRSSLNEASSVLTRFLESDENIWRLSEISELMIETFQRKGNVFSCGNGGSHCDAMHFAEELTGRYRKDRAPLGALALGDSSHLTCVSNDYGFSHVFSRQLIGLANPKDLLLVFSTSGNSENLVQAVLAAKKIPIKIVGLLGRSGGKLLELVDHSIIAPGDSSDRIQEIHIKIVHILIETIEREIFPEHYY